MASGKRILLAVSAVILIPVLATAVLLAVLTATFTRLPAYAQPEVLNRQSVSFPEKPEYTLLTWNIGYAGLGKEMDFFYEEGRRVRPEKEEYRRYLAGIQKLLILNDSCDFILIQEVDIDAKRSYHENQADSLRRVLPGHSCSLAENYNSSLVPLPWYDPMGKVISGLATFSKYDPEKNERIGFQTRYSWPQYLFYFQRCFIVSRFGTPSGRELVLINTHNSAYDKEGQIRKKELDMLKRYMENEYRKGNWVVAGGDWNNNPAGFKTADICTGDRVKEINPPVPASLLPGWKFARDPHRPSNRDVDGPYEKGKTKTTTLDFFVLSPNVELLSANIIETGFENSDHQPLRIKVRLNPL